MTSIAAEFATLINNYAQYEEEPTIIYNEDKWVAINNCQQWNTEDLIRLSYLLNMQMSFILKKYFCRDEPTDLQIKRIYYY
jgi:hypothetical protein